jgi:hypothetical protein
VPWWKNKNDHVAEQRYLLIYIYIYIYHVERGKSPLCVHACSSSAYSPTVAKKNEYTSSISNQNTIFIVSPIWKQLPVKPIFNTHADNKSKKGNA